MQVFYYENEAKMIKVSMTKLINFNLFFIQM